MNYIETVREKVKTPRRVPVLTEDMVWQEHGPLIWQADRFEGTPFFYNIYKFDNYYSYSPFALILKKNSLKINQVALDALSDEMFSNHNGNYTIDEEIAKIGAPHECSFRYNNVDEYVSAIADGMVKDIELIEQKNPGKTNIIMCGGRDSMNLLLLPWKNPIIALSAKPNYPLVRKFIKDNNLDIPIRELKDPNDPVRLKSEALEACCRADLTHWRWGVDLCNVSDEYSKNAILWKGQLGDAYLTHDWKNFITPYVEPQRFFRRSYKKFSYLMPQFIHTIVGHHFQPIVIQRVWEVCSSLQGGHMSFLRAIMDMLVLSGYHGPNVSKIIANADLGIVAQRDIRPLIGTKLLGREVNYPMENPHPKISEFRKDLHHAKLFADMLEEAGVEVVWPEKSGK